MRLSIQGHRSEIATQSIAAYRTLNASFTPQRRRRLRATLTRVTDRTADIGSTRVAHAGLSTMVHDAYARCAWPVPSIVVSTATAAKSEDF